MMRTLRQCLYIMIIGSALLGCQQGVTDVGNPNITEKPPAASPNMQNPGPALGQLIGEYSFPASTASVQSPADGSPSPITDPAAAPVFPVCKTDSQKTPSITSATEPTHIVLNDFLDYGAATDHLLANYDAKTGVIVVQIEDTSLAITSCTGTAVTSNTRLSITLKCQPSDSQNSDCKVTYSKE